jgi:hypothetical protein
VQHSPLPKSKDGDKMRYVKSAQFVPGKGDAWTYYEVDDNGKVTRQMTHIPATGETTRVPDPIVKRLMRPELCIEAEADEFLSLWG